MPKSESDKLLTEVELELMNILWSIGEGNVANVMEQLPPNRDLAYTSVSTVLRILEQKKVVKARKEGRGHVYVPTLSKSTYEARAVRHVVDRVFQGGPMALVRQLVDTVDLKPGDIEELRALVSQLEKRK